MSETPGHEPATQYGCSICRSVYRVAYSVCPRDGGAIAPLVTDRLIGGVFADRYSIEELVGQGAMGRVYRARHLRMSRRFAVKVMFGDLAADAKMRTRFAQEAEAASRLNHPNLISVVDFGETEDGLSYLVMDFIEGESLADLLDREGPQPVERVIELAKGICAGLAHAHERDLIHRDLKSENVVIDGNIPKIVDFGIAKIGEIDDPHASLTAQGCVVGTPAYMSPEQACGEKIDHRSDLFSLGLILYELLAGKKPFDGSAIEVARKNVSLKPPTISERNPAVRVPRALEALIFRMLAKQAAGRPVSAEAVGAELDAIGPSGNSGRGATPAFLVSLSEGTQSTRQAIAAVSRRNFWPSVAVGSVLLFGVSFAVAAWFRGGNTVRAQPADQALVPVDAPRELARAEPKSVPPVERPTPVTVVEPPPPPVSPPPEIEKRPRPKRPPPKPEVEPEDLSTEAFTNLHADVGRLLDRSARKRDALLIARLRKAYFAIPIGDAIRNKGNFRRDAMRTLRSIKKELDGAERL